MTLEQRRLHGAACLDIHGIQRMAAGHEQAIFLGAAEDQIRTTFRQVDMGDGLALRVEDAHAVEVGWINAERAIAAPATPQVAIGIDLEAIDAARTASIDGQLARAEFAAVVGQFIGPDHTVRRGAGLDDVEYLFVGRKRQAIGTGQRVVDQAELAALAVDAIDRMRQFRGLLVAFPFATDAEWWICEPDRTIRFADDVVW